MTFKQYLNDNALVGEAVVTDIGAHDRPTVRLDRTLFHPQGGGQRGDRGRLGSATVKDVRHAEGGEVDHFVDTTEGLAVGMKVKLAVDPSHRGRGALLHSAGHAIADLVQGLRPGLQPVAGHHWHGEARVEFEGAVLLDESLEGQLQAALSSLAELDLPIAVEGDAFTDRKIKVADFPAIGCGGTHLVSTAALAEVKITGIRSKRGRVRVSYE